MGLRADVVIVDGMNLAYRMAHSGTGAKGADLSYNGQPTAVIYGMLRALLGLRYQFTARSMMVAWDGGRPAFRSQLCPTYKANRHTEEDPNAALFRAKVDCQVNLLQEYLPQLGVLSVSSGAMEADDLIAGAVGVLEGRKIVVSSDEDMYQLASEDTHIYRPVRDCLMTVHAIEAEYGFPVAFVSAYRALTGDSSDNLPGARGIGPAKAKALVQRYYRSCQDSLELLRAIVGDNPRLDAQAILNTYEVMDLTHDRAGGSFVVLRALDTWRPMSMQALFDVIHRFGLVSLGSDSLNLSALGPLRVKESDQRTPVVWSGERRGVV